jgi:hypothetical protein
MTAMGDRATRRPDATAPPWKGGLNCDKPLLVMRGLDPRIHAECRVYFFIV